MIARFSVALLAACFTAAVPLAAQQQAQPQEGHPKVPKDSVLVTVTGCLKGRVIRASDVRQEDTTSGVTVTGKSFRLAGKKDAMTAVKDNDGDRVQIMGLIKKSALIEPGMRFFGGRVAVGGASNGTAPTSAIPDPAENVLVMDVMNVQALGGTCRDK
ncbi:MAG: hypothetical protein ACRD1V_12700 [Vicinamibacterales bacterium]